MPSKRVASITPLTFNLSKLWGSPEGTTEKYHQKVKVTFDKDIVLKNNNLEIEVQFVKLKDSVSAIVENLKFEAVFNCSKCLKEFNKKFEFGGVERQYKVHIGDDDSINDNYFIDPKDLLADLTDFIRQEIILHFPLIAVCSLRCKGLCQYCGKNRNEVKCGCTGEENSSYKPFKDLKKLLS